MCVCVGISESVGVSVDVGKCCDSQGNLRVAAISFAENKVGCVSECVYLAVCVCVFVNSIHSILIYS